MDDEKLNLNEFAGEIAKIEGGHQNLTIAQIKEVMNCYHSVLNKYFQTQAGNQTKWVEKIAEIEARKKYLRGA